MVDLIDICKEGFALLQYENYETSIPFSIYIKLSLEQSPSTEVEKANMAQVPYSSAVGSQCLL